MSCIFKLSTNKQNKEYLGERHFEFKPYFYRGTVLFTLIRCLATGWFEL